MFFLSACELSPVLRSSLETDAVPFGAVALPLSLVLLPQTAGQLSSHHLIVTLLQDGTDRHYVCRREIRLRKMRLGAGLVMPGMRQQ